MQPAQNTFLLGCWSDVVRILNTSRSATDSLLKLEGIFTAATATQIICHYCLMKMPAPALLIVPSRIFFSPLIHRVNLHPFYENGSLLS